jgi:hypothetical protein
MSIIDLLTGKKQIREMTGTASIGGGVEFPPLGTAKKKVMRVIGKRPKDDEKKKKRLGESDSEDGNSIIPKAARKIDISGEKENIDNKRDKGRDGTGEDFIPVETALVAPDTTPDAEKALDATQVPNVEKAEEKPSEGGILRSLLGIHQKTFKPELSTGKIEPVDVNKIDEPVTVESIKAKQFAANVMESATSTTGNKGQPDFKYNPESPKRAMDALRMARGD